MHRSQRRRQILLSAAALCLLGAGLVPAAAEPLPPLAGLSLGAALRALEAVGLQIVYTDSLVRPTMRVESEPEAREPRRALDEILLPHGLAARDAPGGRIVVVAATEEAPETTAGPLEIGVASRGLPVAHGEIEVIAHRSWVLGDGLSTLSLGGEELLALPHLGEDLLRSVTLLPGTSGNDVSAGFSVRGSRPDEVMVRLDGLEILEPFHLQDFGDALSILAPKTIDQVELITGGFPAELGDRMGGVLDLTTVEPHWRRRGELGLSLLNARLGGSGTWDEGRGGWLASLRGGSLEPPFRFADEEENPTFWDGFGKLERQLRPGHSLRANLLASLDDLDFSELEGDDDDEVLERYRTRYRSGYLWLSHGAVLGADLYLESRASWSRVERDRTGSESLPAGGEGGFILSDERELDVGALSQGWSYRPGPRHTVRWGFEVRALDTGYDYHAEGTASRRLLAAESGERSFEESFRGEHLSLYAADRLDLGGRLSLDLGLRLDENTVTDAERLSPRLGLVLGLGAHGRLRAAWGHYTQSQRLYELQVEDGETRFAKDELAEHSGLGYERSFGGGGGRPLVFRAELYHRHVSDPRVRYENLFDPISIVPELEDDRVRIAPRSSRSQGLELFFGGGLSRRFEGFVSYTYARVEDCLDGRDVPRAVDQPHSVVVDLTYHAPRRWDLNLSWRYHAGRPTTAIDARLETADDGSFEVVPVLGPLYGERLPGYRRLDLRLSRRWQLPRGRLTFYLEVQNLTDVRNVRGYEVSFEALDDGGVEVERQAEHWLGILPSLGVGWTF